MKLHYWTELRQLRRELFRAAPHYGQITDDWLEAWKPPSEYTPLPPVPLKVTCKMMGLDPRKVDSARSWR